MKRFIAAISFAALAIPATAVEVGAPYEELNLDRSLHEVAANAMHDSSAPFEELTLDRALPSLPQEDAPVAPIADASTVTGTRTDAEIAEYVSVVPSPWSDQHDFIAPAQ
ncbi:MAG TPA: hypothetical protein VG095_02145 [Chthoniobacterales bacterium]|nr:hypothetical protein [Chthoniobacterales bacterium]